MRRNGFAILALCLGAIVPACSAVRKLSKVEKREPASVRAAGVVSPQRERLLAVRELPATCPPELKELFPSMIDERVSFPPCPLGLQVSFEAVSPALNMEERTTIEEILGGQCRSPAKDGFDDNLDSLLNEFELSRPLQQGQAKTTTRVLSSVDEQRELLAAVRAGLEEVRNVHQPLDQWIRRNGEFVIPDEELDFLEKLLLKQQCKMTDQEIDSSYRTIRSLEELARIRREGDPQRTRIERFLYGVHQVMDRKLREFFFP